MIAVVERPVSVVIPCHVQPARVLFQRSGRGPRRRYHRATFYALGPLGAGCNLAARAALRDLDGFEEALGSGTPTQAGEDLLLLLRLVSAAGRWPSSPRRSSSTDTPAATPSCAGRCTATVSASSPC